MDRQQFALIIFLALVFVVVIPVLTYMTGGSLADFLFKGKKKASETMRQADSRKQSIQKNSTRSELLRFLSTLTRAAKKKGMLLVVPGMLTEGKQTARFSALLVSPSGVTGIYCLGYGGQIQLDYGSRICRQTMNGQVKNLPDPWRNCREWDQIGRKNLDDLGLNQVPFQSIAVFTSETAELKGQSGGLCVTAEEFLNMLDNHRFTEDRKVDVAASARLLAGKVKENGNLTS